MTLPRRGTLPCRGSPRCNTHPEDCPSESDSKSVYPDNSINIQRGTLKVFQHTQCTIASIYILRYILHTASIQVLLHPPLDINKTLYDIFKTRPLSSKPNTQQPGSHLSPLEVPTGLAGISSADRMPLPGYPRHYL